MSHLPVLTKKSIEKMYEELERKTKEYDNALCIHCKSALKSSFFKKINVRRTLYDYNEKVGYHKDCQEKYKKWLNTWINMWASIGWHSKIDIMTAKMFKRTTWSQHE